MKKIILVSLLVFSLPLIALAEPGSAITYGSNAPTFASVVNLVITLINKTIPILVALAIVLFMIIGFQYVRTSGGTHGKSNYREALLWGLIALFVLFSIWGILRLLQTTFLNATSSGSAGDCPSHTYYNGQCV